MKRNGILYNYFILIKLDRILLIKIIYNNDI